MSACGARVLCWPGWCQRSRERMTSVFRIGCSSNRQASVCPHSKREFAEFLCATRCSAAGWLGRNW